jgi:hypothetical protein
MKQRVETKLSTAVEKLCRRLFVDAGFYNDHAGGIGGGADSSFTVHRSAFCKARGTRNAVRRTSSACVKWNGFDNFTGDSLSHLVTLNDNYFSRFTRPNQGKSAGNTFSVSESAFGIRQSSINCGFIGQQMSLLWITIGSMV